MKFCRTTVLWPVTLMLSASMAGNASEELPVRTFEGLELISNSEPASIFVEPGFDPGQYDRIYLDEAYIAFKKNWRPRQGTSLTNRVSPEDMDKIRTEMKGLFREVFSRTLRDGGYELTTETAWDVLTVKPAIINLDVVSIGDRAGSNVIAYSESAGEMTLYLELYDSLSGDITARVVDRKRDRQTGYFKWQNRLSNRAAANRILQAWANALKLGLDQANRRLPPDAARR